MREMWQKLRPVWPLILCAIIVDVVILLLAFFMGDARDIPLNLMFVVFGMGLSVPIGFLLSPLTPKEELQFNNVGKALLTFVSGYLLSRLDHAIEAALAPGLLLTATAGFRLVAFVLCFGLGVPTVYLARRQWASDPAPAA